MKKIIRLTEGDLTRLVKRVIIEQSSTRELDVINFCEQNNIPQVEKDDKDQKAKWMKQTKDFTIIVVNFIVPEYTLLLVSKVNKITTDNTSKINELKKQLNFAIQKEKYDDVVKISNQLKSISMQDTESKVNYLVDEMFYNDNWNFEEFKKLIQPYIK